MRISGFWALITESGVSGWPLAISAGGWLRRLVISPGENSALMAQELLNIAKKQGVAGLVIGLPLDQDGRVGPSAQRARTFGFNLVRLAGCRLPIGYWDERFSTRAVERMLISEGDVSRANRAKKIDQLSATYILQGALDYLNQTRKTE